MVSITNSAQWNKPELANERRTTELNLGSKVGKPTLSLQNGSAVTLTLFILLILSLIASCWSAVWLCQRKWTTQQFSDVNVVAPQIAGAVAVTFGLFVSFAASDVLQRSRELRLSSEREASVGRSILKFSESLGPSANLIRRATIEYLQAAITLDRIGWRLRTIANLRRRYLRIHSCKTLHNSQFKVSRQML